MKKATLALTEDDLQLSLPLKDWPYKLSKADDLREQKGQFHYYFQPTVTNRDCPRQGGHGAADTASVYPTSLGSHLQS